MKFELSKYRVTYVTRLEYNDFAMELRTEMLEKSDYLIALDNDVLRKDFGEFQKLVSSWVEIFGALKEQIKQDQEKKHSALALSEAIVHILDRQRPQFMALKKQYYVEYSSINFLSSYLYDRKEEKEILLRSALQPLFRYGNEKEISKKCEEYPNLSESEIITGEIVAWFLSRSNLRVAEQIVQKATADMSIPGTIVHTVLRFPLYHPKTAIGFLIVAFFGWSSLISTLSESLDTMTKFVLSMPYILIYITLFLFFLFIGKKSFFPHIFLPRIIGAVVIGLFFLVFTEQTWEFPLQESSCKILFVSIFMNLLSLIYLVFSISRIENLERKEAISRSLSIFGISLFYTFAISSIFVSLFGHLMTGGIDISSEFFCIKREIQLILCPRIVFHFFPSVVLFYSGLSLFIGIFFQLFWQEKGISEPI